MMRSRPVDVIALLGLAGAAAALTTARPAAQADATGPEAATIVAATTSAAATDAALIANVDTLEAQLSGIDFLPDRDRLDAVATGSAITDLIALSNDGDALAGQRLRALRSLAAYPTPPVRAALLDNLERLRDAESGMDLVYLRAAIEALARVGEEGTANAIADLLEHPSPDIRAAAARGLGDLGDPSVENQLRRRLEFEKPPFVRAALNRALRDLGRP